MKIQFSSQLSQILDSGISVGMW